MKNVTLIREIYSEAFKGIASKFTVSFFKIISLFFLANYAVSIYAVIGTASSGLI